jgi:hypothetical protein
VKYELRFYIPEDAIVTAVKTSNLTCKHLHSLRLLNWFYHNLQVLLIFPSELIDPVYRNGGRNADLLQAKISFELRIIYVVDFVHRPEFCVIQFRMKDKVHELTDSEVYAPLSESVRSY